MRTERQGSRKVREYQGKCRSGLRIWWNVPDRGLRDTGRDRTLGSVDGYTTYRSLPPLLGMRGSIRARFQSLAHYTDVEVLSAGRHGCYGLSKETLDKAGCEA